MAHVEDFAVIEPREDLGILFFRWNTNIDAEQFKKGYNLVLTKGNPKKVHCWLLDTRRRGPAQPESEDWYFNSYLPELQKQLVKEHFIAVLTTPDHYDHIREKVGFQKVEEANKDSLLTMNFFNSEHEAVSWLLGQQQR